MLKLAQAAQKIVNVKTKTVFINNLIFWLHYKITVIILLIGVALLSSQEYIGENIKCLYPNEKLVKFIERYCFFMSTFTVVKHQNKSVLHREIAHPGVGPFVFEQGWKEEEKIQRHTYYQWVVFVLILQAFAFYFPHFLWKFTEKGKLKFLISGIKTIDMLDFEKKKQSFDRIETQLKNRMYTYQSWAWGLIFCEFLNLANLIFQVYITEVFLNYKFISLGPKVFWDFKGDEYNPLDIVFPKVAKCTFQKFGPSGSIQYHDILCVLALNIVNEKIYIFLWFWYLILGILSVWILLWRFLCFFLRRWDKFNIYIFKVAVACNCDCKSLATVMQNISYGEWIFLVYVSENMKGRLFNDFIEKLALTYERPPLLILPTNVFEEEKPNEKLLNTEKPLDFLS